MFRKDGSVYIGEFKKGKLKNYIKNYNPAPKEIADRKPDYPRIDHKDRHMQFLSNLELDWQNRNAELRRKHGMVNPEFQGGSLSDFTHWVNSQVDYSRVQGAGDGIRGVVVEFVVGRDGVVRDVNAIFGTNPVLNAEAVRCVKKSPKWNAAELAGEKKSVRMTVPVIFEF